MQIVGQALCGNESGSGMGSVGRGWNASLVASLINATSVALISAGSVPMKGVVCAVAVGKLSDPLRLALDPSESEAGSLAGTGCFAFLFSALVPNDSTTSHSDAPNHSLIWTNYAGSGSSFDLAELENAKGLAAKGAVAVWRRLKESVVDLESRVTLAAGPTKVKVKKEKAVKKDEVDDEKMEI